MGAPTLASSGPTAGALSESIAMAEFEGWSVLRIADAGAVPTPGGGLVTERLPEGRSLAELGARRAGS